MRPWWKVKINHDSPDHFAELEWGVDGGDYFVMPVSGHGYRVLVQDARAWLLDCGCSREEMKGRGSIEILSEVNRIYDGGLAEFVFASDRSYSTALWRIAD